MCGIVGIFGIENLDTADALVRKMTDRLAHRGPDAEGYFRGSNVVLGHRRLSIIDLNEASNQPFRSADGRYTLIYNGELYNFKEIKEQLGAYNFRTGSDTEVVLAALIQWGMNALQRFNGMFAFAFWDQSEEKLWLVRDRVGIKPLYYAQTDSSLIFASELRSILASGLVEPRIDRRSMDDYLRYQTVHAPNTMVEGIKMLEPGTYMEVSDAEIRHVAYWKPWMAEHADRDPGIIHQQVRERLINSVERRLVADVPSGAFLSGGIDSSLIVGIISEKLGRSIDTFNVSFDESEFSEAKHAKVIADRFNTRHHKILLQPNDLLDALPETLASMDHPSGDGPNTWIISREVKRQGITMALSGLGGDELFAGYDIFKRIPYIADRNWILSFPKPMRALAGDILTLLRPGASSDKTREILTSDYFDLQHIYPVMRQVLLDPAVRRLLGKRKSSLSPNAVEEQISQLERFDAFGPLPTLSRIGIAEMGTYMQNVLLRDTDQMSMAHALEVRVPFLDHELIEYIAHVPDGIKYPHSPKKLLIDSFSDLLPGSVIERPKMGFVLPWEQWLKGDLISFCESRIEALGQCDYFDDEALRRLWTSFLKGDPRVSWSRIWPLITLSDWMQQHRLV